MKSRPFPLIGKYRFGWALFWACVVTLVFSAAIGMNESIRDFPLGWMTAFGAVAVFAGWVFSGCQQKKLVWLLGGLISGFIILASVNSGGYRHLFQAYFEGLKSIRLSLPFLPQSKNFQAIIALLYRLIGDLVVFYNQSISWIQSLFQGRTNFNPTITKTIWGTSLWSASFGTGWLLRRRNHALIASLPILILLAGILGYTRQSTMGLVTALFSLLMMTVLFEHLILENKWQKNQIDFSEEIRFDIASLGIPIIVIIMILASVLPNIPYDEIRETLNQNFFSRDTEQVQIDQSLGLRVTPQVQPPLRYTGSLPRAFLIGAGPELSENLVMEIDTGEIFLPPEVDQDATLPKYYWFGRSYDIYTGTGWLTSEISRKQHPKNETIIPADLTTSRLLTQKINKTTNAPSTLFSSGVPQSVDRLITVDWREGTGEYYASQIEGLEYQVVSPVLDLSVTSLQQADQEAPDVILENYLQINEETPQRVLDLAASITQDTLNPYDKAKAIESYLRQYEYTLDIPPPPDERDVVDYFLFDFQKGYCDYFASAMVILARTVDLPARLAVGYSTGQYDHLRQLFVVTEANAHAWPEVYITPYGWIPFEPTASERTFTWNDSSGRPEVTESEILTEPPEESAKPFWLDLLILMGTVIVFIVVFFFSNKIIKRKAKHSPTRQQIERIHQKTKRHLKRLFFSPNTAKTPLEFQTEIINWLNQQEVSRLEAWLIDRINRNLRNLTGLYHQGLYTPRPLSKNQIKSARQDLTNLVAQAWILGLFFMITGR